MRRPSLARFGLDLREAGARRRIGDAEEMVAGRALNLPAGELRFEFQRLITVGTIKFEVVCAHGMFAFHFIMRKLWVKSR